MKILSLDLGKYKTVGCEYEAETGRHSFVTVGTTPKGLHDLIVDREPDRVVIEICSRQKLQLIAASPEDCARCPKKRVLWTT